MSALPWQPFPSVRTSLPAAVSLCVDFVMRCQGSEACWAGWHGVGKADKSPHCIPATSSSQQGPRVGGGRALLGGRGSAQVSWAGGQDREVGELRRPRPPCSGPLPGNSPVAFPVLCQGSTTSETSGSVKKAPPGPPQTCEGGAEAEGAVV